LEQNQKKRSLHWNKQKKLLLRYQVCRHVRCPENSECVAYKNSMKCHCKKGFVNTNPNSTKNCQHVCDVNKLCGNNGVCLYNDVTSEYKCLSCDDNFKLVNGKCVEKNMCNLMKPCGLDGICIKLVKQPFYKCKSCGDGYHRIKRDNKYICIKKKTISVTATSRNSFPEKFTFRGEATKTGFSTTKVLVYKNDSKFRMILTILSGITLVVIVFLLSKFICQVKEHKDEENFYKLKRCFIPFWCFRRKEKPPKLNSKNSTSIPKTFVEFSYITKF